MKKLIFINLLFISFASADCSLYFFKNTIYTGSKKNLKISDVIRKTDCEKAISSKFHKIVINSSGTLKSKYLKDIEPGVKTFPKHFHLTTLKEILIEKMDLSPGRELDKIRFMSGAKAFHLDQDQFIDISTQFKTGKMAFSIEVIEKNGKTSDIWIEALGTTLKEVFVASVDLSAATEDLGLGLFHKVKRKITNSNLYFLNELTLPFYKLNRSLREGEILKKSFLIKKNLVNYGTPTKIIYKKGNLVLKSMGIPLGTGRLGDFVKLKNPKNKKEIYGQVNGLNSVLVGI